MRVFNLLKTRIEEMEEKGDVDGLIHALNDESENVRREAMMALERIGDIRATEPLIQILQDHDITLQEEAITALGRIRDKKAVPALIQTLNNQHIGIRWRTAEALGKIGDPQATEPLIQTLQDLDKTIQEEAITALGRIRDKKAVPALIQTLNNQHIGIRWRTAEALGKIGDPQATEPLIQTLQDPDKTIQEEAITALGRIAVDPFIKDLQNEDQQYRDNALIALNHLRELKITEQVEITKSQIESSAQDENLEEKISDETLAEEEFSDDTRLDETSKEPGFNIKNKELIKTGFHIYIENFVKNSRYNYLDGFNTKSRYDYEFIDIRKLRDLLKYRGLEFSDEEVTWLIHEEIKNQEYREFKEKILAQHPENLTDYIEILIKTYPEPKDQTEHLKKLLNQQDIKHEQKLIDEIEKTQKQLEITEFENKLIVKEAQTPDEKDSPSILKEFRKKELKENRDLMRVNGKYVYIETFVKKSRYNYEFGDIRKFRELLTYKRMEFSEDDLLWLIHEEIKNQEYREFKEKILAQHPENLTDYIEILIKTYPEPKDQTEHLKKLLNQQDIKHEQKLIDEIEKTQKQLEITEFENKLLVNGPSNEGVLPVEMEDLDEVYISYNIGNLFYDFGKLEKALSYYGKALYIYPDFIDAWKNRGLIFFTMGRLQRAAACYNQILHLNPKYPELWVDIGMIFFEIGRVTEAKACYEKAIEINPCYQSEDLAVETRKFLENRPVSLEKLHNYLELASSASWESSDPTPPLSRIIRILNKNLID
jgi:HEAT repeat protein/tetratricopeptide (TPR) repeat protein